MGLKFLTTMSQLHDHYTHNPTEEFAAFVIFSDGYNATPIGTNEGEVLDLSGFVRYGTGEPNTTCLLIGNMENRSVSIIPFDNVPSLASINEFAALTTMEQFHCLFAGTGG
ncbi:Hypothetical protein GLP15_1110 [Giardia lamblia P15]|uniref:Uncharacterized protein n=1 Tax=Giardia intestinalis (strain P15) TaxID=658858 RepID=E1F2J3_GIAIA|nr:Hypothetical protein GLP15_1110 [Giardia lamblia P15]